MANPTSIISSVTIDLYLKGRWENFKKNNPFFGILEAKAHILNGQSGEQLNWRFRAGTYQPVLTSEYQDVSQYYIPNAQYATATLPWGRVSQFDAVSKDEFAKNDGDQALVKLRDYRMPDMADDLLHRSTTSLAYQILNQDGPAYSGTGMPIYGLPSFFGALTTTTTADLTAVASDSYGGQSTALSGVSGITNVVDNAWTPTLVNSTSSGFGSGASARNNVLEYLSYGMRNVTFDGNDPTQRPTFGITNGTTFDYARAALGAKQTIYIDKPVSADDVWGIGTNVQAFQHDGIKFYWDSNMPATTTYILNADQLWLHSLKVPGKISGDSMPGAKPGKDMFDTEVNYNDQRMAVTVSMTWRGQLRGNPRYQCKVFPYA